MATGTSSRVDTASRPRTLPAAQPVLSLQRPEGLPQTPVQQTRVLVAAAESVERAQLETLLRSWGHEVSFVDHDAALLDMLDQPEPASILILDAALPGLNGLALLHRLQLQSSHRRSWTILLGDAMPTSFPDSFAAVEETVDRRTTQATHNMGVERLLSKPDLLARPIDAFELRVCIQSALRVQSLYAEMAESVDAIRFHATHDSLTGLWSRDSLLDNLFHETDRAQRLGTPLAFLLFDLDRFTQVNQEHNYDGGDNILRQLASRVRRCLRSYDLIGRCGEDEFLIGLPGGSIEEARSMALRLREQIAERPFELPTGVVRLTASFGIAQSGGRSPLVVLREAETALAGGKLAGGDCVRFFVPGPDGANSLAPQKVRPSRHKPGRRSISA